MEPRTNILRVFGHAYRHYTPQIAILALLGFFSSILAGIGIGAVIPLLSFLFIKEAGELNAFAKFIGEFFNFFNVPYTIEYVLALIVGIFFIRAIILLVFSLVSAKIRGDYKERTSKALIDGLLGADWKFYLSKKSGFMQDIILRDVDSASKLLESFAQMVLAFISAVILLIFVFFISPTITALSAVIGIFLILVFRPLMKGIRKIGRESSAKNKEVSQYLIEHTIGMKTIKTSGTEEEVHKIGAHHFAVRRALELRRALFASFSTVSIEPVSIFFIASIFGVSHSLPGFDFQVFAAAMILVQRIFIYLQSGQTSIHIINENISHVLHVMQFQSELASYAESHQGKRQFSFSKEITFQNVSFRHSGSPLLHGLNFSIGKGEMFGLIGPSGSGKTSTADLIMRLVHPEEGSILLDGIDSTTFDLTGWRTNIGYVSQDVFLLNDTIENNIRFYAKDVSRAEMAEAAKKANIYEFITGLEDEFQTIVGDRGILLSGGQRQRIALARVLVRCPEILILDEATSSLDNESEVLIQKAIEALRGKVTVLVIAHRLSTVLNVDTILVLDQGRIVEQGNPKELLASPDSYFYRMYHLKEFS